MSAPLTESGTGSVDFDFGERVSMLFGVQAGSLSGMSIVLLIAYKMVRIGSST
ncbi:hypothetical protein FA13DRAFT_1806280 [Coprinellus micaceus]|uniref:Uncharacterized protein n=1 Tax=Coprinellus micaceus TaxID=71717 RepID=A0A4Y7RNN6_COPMI|nr:hypothetical protein FA13DRAFT_1806280 [Coprinellus micaceus]